VKGFRRRGIARGGLLVNSDFCIDFNFLYICMYIGKWGLPEQSIKDLYNPNFFF
jgi:hypothetical protein